MPKQKTGKEKDTDKSGRHYEPAVDENGEDEMVKRFRENLQRKQLEKEKGSSESSKHTSSSISNDPICQEISEIAHDLPEGISIVSNRFYIIIIFIRRSQ